MAMDAVVRARARLVAAWVLSTARPQNLGRAFAFGLVIDQVRVPGKPQALCVRGLTASTA